MHGREERCEEEEIWERGSIATPEHMHTGQTPGCAGRGRAAMRVTCSAQCQHPPEGIPQHSHGPGTVQLREESRGTCHLSPSEPRCVMKLKAAARTAGRYLHRQLSLFKNSELEQDSNSWSAEGAQTGRKCTARAQPEVLSPPQVQAQAGAIVQHAFISPFPSPACSASSERLAREGKMDLTANAAKCSESTRWEN